MKGRDGRAARAKALWKTPKPPPTTPAIISAAKSMADPKSCDGSIFEVVVGARVKPSKAIPQKTPPIMTKIEAISEIIAMVS